MSTTTISIYISKRMLNQIVDLTLSLRVLNIYLQYVIISLLLLILVVEYHLIITIISDRLAIIYSLELKAKLLLWIWTIICHLHDSKLIILTNLLLLLLLIL